MSAQIKGTGNSVLGGADLGTPLAEASGGTGVSTVLAATKTALNASGSAPVYACRTWVNFNGTGTVAIRASGNVSSITDNGVGDYTVNFTTAMPDENYSVTGGSGIDGAGAAPTAPTSIRTGARAAGSIRVGVNYAASGTTGAADEAVVYVAIFR